MTTLEEALGIDQNSPEDRRALAHIAADAEMIKALIAIRKSAKLSQKQVADLLGIKQSSVAAFERYENDPKLSTVRRYSQAVGALVSHLVAEDRGQLFEPSGFTAVRLTGGLKISVMTPALAAIQIPAPTVASKRSDFAMAA